MYRPTLLLSFIILITSYSAAQDVARYEAALNNGIRRFDQGNFDAARQAFLRAKSFAAVTDTTQVYDDRLEKYTTRFELVYDWIDRTYRRLVDIARYNESVARYQRNAAEAARDSARQAQRVAETNATLARLAEEKALREEKKAAAARDASIARHLAFGAVEEKDPDTALFLAYHALAREFARDTFYTGVRKAFGDAIYRYSRVACYPPEDSTVVRNFFPLPVGDRVLVLAHRSQADTVAGPDRLEAWTLRAGPAARGPAFRPDLSYALPARYRVRTLAFDSTGTRFVTGSTDGKILLWSIGNPIPLDSASLKRPVPIHTISFATDRQFVLAAEDGTVETWTSALDRLAHRRTHASDADAAPVYAIGFAPSSRRFFTRGAGSGIQVWAPERTQPLASLPVPVYAYEAALYPDGSRLLIAGATGRVEWRAVDSGASLGTLDCSVDRVTRFAFADTGNRIFMLAADGRLLLTGSDPSAADCRIFDFGTEITTAQFAPATDSLLLLGFANGNLRLLDSSTELLQNAAFGQAEAVKMAVSLADDVAIRKVAYSATGRYWLALDERGQLVISQDYTASYERLRKPPPRLSATQRRLFLGEKTVDPTR